MQTRVQFASVDGKADILLQPPAGKPPTLDEVSLGELEQGIIALAKQPPRVVVLRSSEPKYFCVGANLEVLKNTNEESIVPWTMLGHHVLNQLSDLPCPVLAQVRGYTMGGGLELAMACDLIFADQQAKFAQSEATLGFIPGWGGSHRLVERVGVATAKRLFFSGATLGADEALTLGLIDQVAPPETLDSVVDKFTQAVIRNSPYAIAAFKQIVNNARRPARDRNTTAEVLASRGCLSDPDTRNRLDDFLNKRK
jgi:enoyl-CoA hydratase